MKNREIGKSGIFVPFLGLGTWAIGGGTWWGDNDDRESIRAIQAAADSGIMWIDTAPMYGFEHSEQVLGEALKGRRENVILSTKCGLQWEHKTSCYHKTVEGIDVYRDLSKKEILKAVDRSLMNLKTDYLDVYYTHWQAKDFTVWPIEETMDALMTLKKQGKIRAIGASNVTTENIEEYCKYGQLDVIQEKYSILTRSIEKMIPSCKKYGVSIQAYSPLEQGLLTGKATMETELAPGDVRQNNIWWRKENRSKVLRLLEHWKPYCEKYHCSYGNLIIALTARMMEGIHVLCGARTVKQVDDNVKSMNVIIEDADRQQMEAEVRQIYPEHQPAQ
ncbi:aldo/keto reductase [Mediterraneibacter sp. NSJ-55]|uniref:Aldo/keto reductase n=1 Tax=Mediterraneibacter hominis TaxID=2763054 RepID=A0A923LIC3_9FIRM|nr:aldo/keto reductase [Mediterraneibacter hominis]MBC5689290.1 aldo/keto reductase [Mediterraneibacter hominis]